MQEVKKKQIHPNHIYLCINQMCKSKIPSFNFFSVRSLAVLEETLYKNSQRKVECEESSEKPLSKQVS